MTTHNIRTVPVDPLAAAAALGPDVAGAAEQTERAGRISTELWEKIRDAGLLRMWLPKEVGGSETELPTISAVCEELGRHDGSAAWVTMIGSGTNYLMTSLPADVVREIFAPDPDIATGGLLVPLGRARRVDGGFRVSGRWSFGSGCELTRWMIGGAVMVDERGEPELDDEGKRVTSMFAFPTEDVTIHRTWDVSGLRGTGSHDYEVEDVFVPEERAFLLSGDRTAFAFPHARLPLMGALGSQLAAVLLGMARGALDALLDQVAGSAHRLGPPRDRPLLQARLAEAEGLIRSSKAFLYEALERAWARAKAGDPPTAEHDFALRLASSHAARSCTKVADLALTAGGTASLYAKSPVQRFHRDIYAAQQHGLIAYYSFEGLGKELMAGRAPQ